MESVPNTMRALRKETPTPGYSLDTEHPVPEPLGDEVLIKVDSVAICGSDIALYNWSEVAQADMTRIILSQESLCLFSRLSPRFPSSLDTRQSALWSRRGLRPLSSLATGHNAISDEKYVAS